MVTILLNVANYLNQPGALESLSSPPRVGRLYAASYQEGNTTKFYRCRILSVSQNGKYDVSYASYYALYLFFFFSLFSVVGKFENINSITNQNRFC